MKVGFIGIGKMGSGMARAHLRRRLYDLERAAHVLRVGNGSGMQAAPEASGSRSVPPPTAAFAEP